tara:strand:- start:293 stop:622 length:330 start_codon:yes stop_codon:yes gene_type:complete
MAVTWKVKLEGVKTVGSLSDVVTVIHWSAIDSETVDGVDHSGYLYGCESLAEPDSSNFTALGSITNAIAIGWAKAALGSDKVTEIETGIAAQITESKTPTKFENFVPSS